MGELVSIIVPVKNEARNVGRFIEGVKRQTYRPIEVIFVDGGSTDGTREVIESLAREISEPTLMIRLLKEEDYGPLRSLPNARNIGVKEAKGRYIVFFDADFDLSYDAKVIEKIVNALQESEHVAITYVPNMHTWIERGLALDDIIYYSGGGKPLHVLCAFRREVFNRVFFNPNLDFGEDTEFLGRIATKPIIVDSEVRRCYPHTFKEYVRQQVWYGRTVLRFYKVVGYKRWQIQVARNNAIIGFLVLSLLLMLLNILAALLPLAIIFLIIVARWLRKDIKFFGLQNTRNISERFVWLLFREVCGKLSFDLGLIKAILGRNQLELGR